MQTSNKTWKHQWLWATKHQLNGVEGVDLPSNERVKNKFQVKTTWALVRLTKSETKNINLALKVIEESRNWLRLITLLPLFYTVFLSVQPEDNIDYPLWFHIQVHADVNSALVEVKSLDVNDPKSGDKISKL